MAWLPDTNVWIQFLKQPGGILEQKLLHCPPDQIIFCSVVKGPTWYALAKRAGIPNQATIRDIEQGKDAKLSNLQAVAPALGLELEVIEVVT